MKRIRSQCLLQTLHFLPDPAISHEEGMKKMEEEIADYKLKVSENVKIVKEAKLEDGSVLLKVKKKVSKYDVGNYFKEN